MSHAAAMCACLLPLRLKTHLSPTPAVRALRCTVQQHGGLCHVPRAPCAACLMRQGPWRGRRPLPPPSPPRCWTRCRRAPMRRSSSGSGGRCASPRIGGSGRSFAVPTPRAPAECAEAVARRPRGQGGLCEVALHEVRLEAFAGSSFPTTVLLFLFRCVLRRLPPGS